MVEVSKGYVVGREYAMILFLLLLIIQPAPNMCNVGVTTNAIQARLRGLVNCLNSSSSKETTLSYTIAELVYSTV